MPGMETKAPAPRAGAVPALAPAAPPGAGVAGEGGERIPCLLEHLVPGAVGAKGSGRTGEWVGEGTVRGYRIGPGADLRNAQLAGANLCGYDLTGADLRGANCVGTLFRDSYLTGAKFQGARVWEADIIGAHCDLALFRDPRPHPFFPERPDPVGMVRLLAPASAEDALEQPRCLAFSPDGGLHWLQGGQVQTIGRQGLRFPLGFGDQEILGLQADPEGSLWVFGRKHSRYHLTFCRIPGIGRTGLAKGGRGTDRLLVVTAPWWNGEEWEHDLVTAFPVP